MEQRLTRGMKIFGLAAAVFPHNVCCFLLDTATLKYGMQNES